MSDPADNFQCVFERSIEVPAAGSARPRLEQLLAAPPGPDLARELYGFDRGQLTEDELILLLQGWERANAWGFAQQMSVLAEIAGPEPTNLEPKQDPDWVREEVAAALRVAPATSGRRIRLARLLSTWLRPTWDAMNSGRIGHAHLFAIAEKLEHLPEHTARLVQREILEGVDQQTLPAFRRALNKLVLKLDPRTADERHQDDVACRRVVMWPDGEGTATLAAEHLPASEAQLAMIVVDTLARQIGADDPRTLDQRRADMFCQVFQNVLAEPDLPKEHRRRPDVQVVIDLPTLLGLADNPAELIGYGPIPPGLARRVAYDGKWRRLVTDPMSGALLDYGRTVYEPPSDLADFIIARDQRCRFPGCSRRASRCELDHKVPFEEGGCTCPLNLCALCKRHHDAKHQAGWSYELHDDGGLTWTSPVGLTYYAPPPLLE